MNKKETEFIIPAERVESSIYVIRDQKVIIDRYLAALYGVETKKLLQAVKRNINRFPDDFMFQLSKAELENWRSQIVTTNSAAKMGLRRRPYAFTEQGVAMLSSVLHSPTAIAVNIKIMRAFVKMRKAMASGQQMTKEVAELKSFLLKHSHKSDREFKRIWNAIEKLSVPPTEKDQRQMGFDLS